MKTNKFKAISISIISMGIFASQPSYSTEDRKEDLQKRQTIVSKQLEEHQRLNWLINNPQPTFYQAIQEAQYEDCMNDLYDNLYASQKYGADFGSVYSVPIITTPEVISFQNLNKAANNAKHNW